MTEPPQKRHWSAGWHPLAVLLFAVLTIGGVSLVAYLLLTLYVSNLFGNNK